MVTNNRQTNKHTSEHKKSESTDSIPNAAFRLACSPPPTRSHLRARCQASAQTGARVDPASPPRTCTDATWSHSRSYAETAYPAVPDSTPTDASAAPHPPRAACADAGPPPLPPSSQRCVTRLQRAAWSPCTRLGREPAGAARGGRIGHHGLALAAAVVAAAVATAATRAVTALSARSGDRSAGSSRERRRNGFYGEPGW